MNELSVREAIPVTIGYMEMYCEKFKASAVNYISEQTTVSAKTQIINRSKKATRLVFSGRVYNENQPLRFVLIANTMDSLNEFTIEYRGLKFTGCVIQSFDVEDKGDDFIYVTATVITPNSIGVIQ